MPKQTINFSGDAPFDQTPEPRRERLGLQQFDLPFYGSRLRHRRPEYTGDAVTIRYPTNGADSTSTLRRMCIVDVVQNLGEFARMANDPQSGKAMAIFFQRPVDA